MKKVLRYGFRGLLVIIGIIAVLWIGLLLYVTMNEQKLTKKLSDAITQRTKGETQIKKLSVSLFRTFPILSLQLHDVVLRDSMYAVHRQDLLKASDIYLKLSLRALIHGEPALGKVIIRNGAVNLFVDSTGTGNTYVLKREDKPAENNKPLELPGVSLSNIVFTFTNLARHKLYQADIRDLNCTARDDSAATVVNMALEMMVRHLAFNTKKGSFARDKPIEGKLALVLVKQAKKLIAKNIRLNIGEHQYVLDGFFSTNRESPDFALKISAQKIPYADALAVLNEHIQKKMKKYSIAKPIDVAVQLAGQTVYGSEPRVDVTLNVARNTITAPQGVFEDCSFKGYFSNEMVKGKPLVDANSILQLRDFSSNWQDIFFKSKSVKIYNFDRPVLECDIAADVDMTTVNKLSGSTTLQFQKGKANVDINYKGPIDADKMSIPDIDGQVKISGAEVKYLPRNFLFTNLNGLLIFKDHDLSVKKIAASLGSTKLEMSGYAKSLLSLLIVSPEKLETSWQIQSPLVNLEDFTGFLSKGTEEKKTASRAEFGKASSSVDKMLREGEVLITLSSPTVVYKNFKATDAHANIILRKEMLQLQKASCNHANGSMEISGSLTNGPGINPVTLHARMANMNIPLLFKAFDNFGQDAITHENLRGTLSADINLKSAITDKAKMVTGDSKGTIEFLLQDGELNHFEPILRVGEKVFKKQNFDEIKFADLKNRLDVTGTTFIVNPMEIRSTAITLFVEGIYDVKKGSDMSIQMPLKNLTKSQANTDLNTDVKNKKGVSLRLRARTGDDGKLKLSWDPFRRSIRNKEDVKDSTRQD